MTSFSMSEDARPTMSMNRAVTPSKGLLTAALAGLVGLTAGCEEEDPDAPDWSQCPAPEAGPAPAPPDAGAPDNTFDAAADAAAVPMEASAPEAAAPEAAAPGHTGTPASDAAVGLVRFPPEKGVKTRAQLEALCDQKGGYIQMHASCSGANMCRGFSYGDWDEEAELQEHTCASANGCVGLSCVYTGADSPKTVEELWQQDYGDGKPASCRTCHSPSTKVGNEYVYDYTKFRVFVMPGSTRTAANAFETMSAYAMEQIIAFGKVVQHADGTTNSSMRGYHQLLSRKDIKRLIEYLRKMTPEMKEIPMVK
jgi:hypothetical protein